MKKSTNFSISFAVFPRFAHQKVNFLKRDIEHFIKYGYSIEEADALKLKIDAFADIPTDEEFEGTLMIATEKKNKESGVIQNHIREMMLSVGNKFGKDSAHYKRFRASALSGLTDEKLVRTAKRVGRVATLSLDVLAPSGLSVTDVEALEQLIEKFEKSLVMQDDAISEREIGTLVRIDESNAIYEKIARFCETGKGIWKNRNEAKYNDYIIYDTPNATADDENDRNKKTAGKEGRQDDEKGKEES
jgi:hypothetical protein